MFALIYATYAVAKRKPEKNLCLYGIRTLDLCDMYVCMYVCKSLFKHGKSSIKLKLQTKTNCTTTLHDCPVGIRYISYLLDISLKMRKGYSIS